MALLECQKLKKTYQTKDSRTVAITNFSLSFPESGIVAIQGKSGSGKSTLLCLLAMFDEPDSGAIKYNGQEYSSFKNKDKVRFSREETSFIFQHYGLFEEMTVWENIMLPLNMIGEHRSQTKDSIGFLLTHFKMEGYEKRKVSTLSGGEKQRVALIRALVKSPRILFADEPTGALDQENGEEVMKMLYSMSGSSLIIMVSHNQELVERYADRIITLKDGIKMRTKTIRERDYLPSPRKKRHRSSLWCFSFLKTFLGQDVRRNILAFLCGLIGALSILLCAGYLLGSPRSIETSGKKSLEYLSSYLTRKETVSVSDSPLALTRQIKPTFDGAKEFLKDFPEASIEDDLSFFFPSQTVYRLGEEEFSDASFVPVYDVTLNEYGRSLLTFGEPMNETSLLGCYVNDVYAKLHNVDTDMLIEVTSKVPVKSTEIEDVVELELSMPIKGVVEEFPFLNTPKIYYSYPAFSQHLRGLPLEKFSDAFHKDFTVNDFLEIYPGSYLGNGYQVFFHSPELMERVFALMEEKGEYSLESTPHTSVSSFVTLSEAFQMCLLLLLGISCLGIVGVTGMSFLSLFLKRKQEIALLFSLGATRGEALSIFVSESALLILLYSGLSFLIYPYLERAFNLLLYMNFGMADLISLPSFLVISSVRIPIIAIFLVANLLIGLLSTILPILFSMRTGLRKELRDE